MILPGFDRDLGIAGRAMVRAGDGSIVPKLLKIDRPSMFSNGVKGYGDMV